MRRRIILFLLIGITALYLVTPGTFAWFSDTMVNEKVFQSGEIVYELSDHMIDSEQTPVIVPGQHLYATNSLNVTNKSSIPTHMRLRITISCFDKEGEVLIPEYVYVPPPADPLDDNPDHILFLELDENWVFDSDANCYNLQADSADYILPAYDEDAVSETVYPVFSSLFLDGDKVDNDFAGAAVTITLTIQGKQAHFVDWLTLGTYAIDLISEPEPDPEP